MSIFSQASYVITDRGISSPVHGREVVDGLNAIYKRFFFQLISTVQLTGAKRYDTHMVMQSITRTSNVSLESECQKHLYTVSCKHLVIDQVKYQKRASKRNWTKREYHIQNYADIAHKYVKIKCNTNQFPSLSFCGTHTKPHGLRGLSNHYHMRFYPKLGHGICAIRRIPCACAECTYMFYKHWIPGLTPKQQPRYQPVTDFYYWPFIDYFNKWNIITLSHKSTTSEAFEEINQFFLDVISNHMASLVQNGRYGAMNTTDTSTMRYYVIKFVSETYILQEDTTCNGKIISSGEIVVKTQYLSCIQ